MPRLSLQRRPAEYVELARAEAPLDRAMEVPQIDPRNHDPNSNPAIGSVGPHSTGGQVMHAEAWDGWPDGWSTPWMEHGTSDWSGFGYGRQSPDGYMKRVSTVMTCVDLNTSQLASFPAYGVDGDRTVSLPSWSIRPEPSIYTDWSDFMLAAGNDMYLHGECFIHATGWFANGYPARFIALPAGRMTIKPDENGVGQYFLDDDDYIPRREILHIRYQVLAGRAHGLSPLEWIGRNLASAAALEAYATEIARHGVWAVLKHPANLDNVQATDLQNRWMTARAANAAAPAVLSGGVDFETVSLSPKDMALLDLKTFDEQKIAAAFRTPPYLVGVDQPGSMTYSNTHQLSDHHWRVGLRTVAKKIATALSLWTLPGSQRMEFDRDEYIRPGPGERAQYYSTLANIEQDGERALTIDEIRTAERLLNGPNQTTPELLTGANP